MAREMLSDLLRLHRDRILAETMDVTIAPQTIVIRYELLMIEWPHMEASNSNTLFVDSYTIYYLN
jgi:hypothetical protein